MGRKVDLTGQRFGKLVVLGDSGKRCNGAVMWDCACDCGEKSKVRGDGLKSGRSKSCGCMVCGKIDLTGQRFGKWTVLREAEQRNKYGHVRWECLCDCGKYKSVSGDSLREGKSVSCGCKKKKEDLTGRRFGKLVVTNLSIERRGGNRCWECDCDCGETTIVMTGNLTSGGTTSCGCNWLIDLTGKRFGKLVVLEQCEKRSACRQIKWTCSCDCGKQTEVDGGSLRSGNTRSCGCLHRGENHYFYNPDLTDEERLKNRYQLNGNNIATWRTNIYTRDNYT